MTEDQRRTLIITAAAVAGATIAFLSMWLLGQVSIWQ
jgi:hypothetical protein